MSSPRVEALAYRIWAYAEPMGWNVTSRDIADEVGVSASMIGAICRRKGWTNRLRNAVAHPIDGYFTDQDDDQFGSTELSV